MLIAQKKAPFYRSACISILMFTSVTAKASETPPFFEDDIATIDPLIQGLVRSPYSFSKSKRLLSTKIYPKHQIAFYSGCRYRKKQKRLIPIASSCGFKYRKNKARSQRIEWEHIVPAWHFGHQLKCCQNGGRSHYSSSNPVFKQMEADMHNLVPAIGEINGDRSNFPYGMISGNERFYGPDIDMKISFKDRLAEPPDNVKGDVARAYFYMVSRYDLQLSGKQKKLFIAWNNIDPADRWEHEKNQMVKDLQGDENLYITHYKKLKQGDIVSAEPSTNFSDVYQGLKQRFGFFFDYLPVKIVEVLLALFAIYLLWRRRSKGNKKQETAQKPREQSKPRSRNNPKAAEKVSNDSVLFESQLVKKVLALNSKQQLVIETATGDKRQHWKLIPSNQTEGFVFIENRHTKTVLEIEEGNAKDHAPLVLASKKRRDNNHQEWKIKPIDPQSPYCFIENRATGTVLDISYKKTQQGSKVAAFHKKTRGTENQRWKQAQ